VHDGRAVLFAVAALLVFIVYVADP